MMLAVKSILCLASIFAPVASTPWTGFNYGAFWGYPENVKGMEDFRDSFNYAKNLSAKFPFDSARLFTCKRQGTKNIPTGAFDAAVQTKTNLLLGFWITPAKRGDSLDDIIKNEMSALEQGFMKHGQSLADLIIGLSVGSEDIYRFEDTQESGVSKDDVSAAIKKVRDAIASSSFAEKMKGKPIGHVDTAKHVVVDGADFYGITAYPYWNNESIADANSSFLGLLKDVKQRAGKTPVWIAEMGWPYQGVQRGQAVASADNMQQFWDEVGCNTVGSYPTFWFELLKDSTADQPDWGVLDPITKQPRIKNFTCAARPELVLPSSPASLAPISATQVPFHNTTVATSASQTSNSTRSNVPFTVYVTTTVMVTVDPPRPNEPTTTIKTTSITKVTTTVFVKPSSSTAEIRDITKNNLVPRHETSVLPWCVIVADVDGNGQFLPVAGTSTGIDGKCASPPVYTGLPYVVSTTSEMLVTLTAPSSNASVESSTIMTTAPLPSTPLPSTPLPSASLPSTSLSSKSACVARVAAPNKVLRASVVPISHRSSSTHTLFTMSVRTSVSSSAHSRNHTSRRASHITSAGTFVASKLVHWSLSGFSWPSAKPTTRNVTSA